MPTREVETGNDGTTPYVLDGEESHVDAVPLPPLTMPPARRRDLMEAIQRMSQALAAAVPEECAAMSAELALLGERIRAALESCKASHSMPTE
jgi:CRISPR/Cas system-associated protein Csm6